jgi:hypothetical protein
MTVLAVRLRLMRWDTSGSPDGECSPEVQAQDFAGKVATVSVRLMVRNGAAASPLQLTLSAQPHWIRPVNGKLVPVTFAGTVSGAESGLTMVWFKIRDEYGRVQPTGAAPVRDGRFHITVHLEARRHGEDRDGRHYTITANATDGAGNHITAAADAIVPHDRGK